MLEYLLEVIGRSKPRTRILVQTLRDKVLARVTDRVVLLSEFQGRELDFLLLDHFDELLLAEIIRKEGHVAEQHLVQEDAEGPPVQREGVALAFDHFGRHVLLGSTNRRGELALLEVASHAEVDQADVAVLTQHHVFQFQVPVHDVALVEVSERSYNLHCVEFGVLLRNVIELAKQLE